MWMKFTWPLKLSYTALTLFTTGAHRRLWQKAGVAKVTTVGLPDLSASATVSWYRPASGAASEVSLDRSGSVASVRLWLAGGVWPISGADTVEVTSIVNCTCDRVPSGRVISPKRPQ